MSQEQYKILEVPNIQSMIDRMLATYGYRHASTMPVAEVRNMFIEYFKFEHDRSIRLQELLEEHMRLCTCHAFVKAESKQNSIDSVGTGMVP